MNDDVIYPITYYKYLRKTNIKIHNKDNCIFCNMKSFSFNEKFILKIINHLKKRDNPKLLKLLKAIICNSFLFDYNLIEDNDIINKLQKVKMKKEYINDVIEEYISYYNNGLNNSYNISCDICNNKYCDFHIKFTNFNTIQFDDNSKKFVCENCFHNLEDINEDNSTISNSFGSKTYINNNDNDDNNNDNNKIINIISFSPIDDYKFS